MNKCAFAYGLLLTKLRLVSQKKHPQTAHLSSATNPFTHY